MISKEIVHNALVEAFEEFLNDRTLAIGTAKTEEDIKEFDDELNYIQEQRMKTLQNATSEDREETAQDHIKEYLEKGRYFPEGKTEASYMDIIINDVCVFTDLYMYELEFFDSTPEEINAKLSVNKTLSDLTTVFLGGAKAVYEKFLEIQKDEQN